MPFAVWVEARRTWVGPGLHRHGYREPVFPHIHMNIWHDMYMYYCVYNAWGIVAWTGLQQILSLEYSHIIVCECID